MGSLSVNPGLSRTVLYILRTVFFTAAFSAALSPQSSALSPQPSVLSPIVALLPMWTTPRLDVSVRPLLPELLDSWALLESLYLVRAVLSELG